MRQRTNYHTQYMSDDYRKLMRLLDDGNVVVCFVDYVYDTGARRIIYRDVAKAKSNDYAQGSGSYGYVVEARGIVYLNWDRRMMELRGESFEQMCDRLNLQFIDNAEY